MPKFYTKKGWLTPYAMACGYLHRQEARGVSILLKRLETDAPAYSVERWDRASRNATNSLGHALRDGLAYCETFASIKAARAAYRRQNGGKLKQRFESAPEVRRSVFI